MSSKKRTPISQETSAEVLFASDRTCCVCRERGKTLQIHHIDENPSNNAPYNLSVLCLECHNDTQIRGGFGRKLNIEQVTKYRDDWFERVQKRRDEADRVAIGKLSNIAPSEVDLTTPLVNEDILYNDEGANKYINDLPELKRELKDQLHKKLRKKETTANIVQSYYEYIDALQAILITMSHFYPPNTFKNDPHEFFSEQIASRFSWHYTYSEPNGSGNSGTIVHITVAKSVTQDVEKMVVDMAMNLKGFAVKPEWTDDWIFRWNFVE